MAGYLNILLILLLLSEIAFFDILFKVILIICSISYNHFSTFPFFSPSATFIFYINFTFSFSDDIIPPTIIGFSNSSKLTASKHLLICLYTLLLLYNMLGS